MNSNGKSNCNGNAVETINAENNEVKQEITPELPAKQAPKEGRTRRTKALIEAEYQEFKEFYDSGCPILEISTRMKITKAQCTSYMSKISLDKNKHEQKYGVCKGCSLPESIREMLKGGKEDLFKYEKRSDGVFLMLFDHKN
ncbi:MAG: hypothetical protein LHW64_11630 [Candidatus Cloacimonetes bacterium]|nr:hypothetical protein [Candidatus Cloacimonadota bacterium]MDY0230735.1 hypothetical protein [Candidatus Cloacimonadaceae bacterium]